MGSDLPPSGVGFDRGSHLNEPLRSQSPHLQIEQIDGLLEAAGVEATRAILDAFWRSTSDLMASLSEQVSGNALDLASQTAHAVKGSAANVGAQRLAETTAMFEAACQSGDHKAVIETLDAVIEDFAALRDQFETHLANA